MRALISNRKPGTSETNIAGVFACEMVLYHHERVDGSGYPKGLKEDQIPLGARILSVSDAFDAMTTDRSYRAKLTLDEALEQLNNNKGTQFDTHVVDAFLSIMKMKGIPESSEFHYMIPPLRQCVSFLA